MAEPPEPVAADAILRTYLRERTVACPGCGYDLRNLHASRCPECASDIELGIRLTEPRIGWLLAGLCGLVAGAGFSTLLTLYFFIAILIRGEIMPRQIWHTFLGFTTLPAVIQIALISLYVRKWNSIRLMTAPRRRILVLACWAVPAINLLLFSANIR